MRPYVQPGQPVAGLTLLPALADRAARRQPAQARQGQVRPDRHVEDPALLEAVRGHQRHPAVDRVLRVGRRDDVVADLHDAVARTGAEQQRQQLLAPRAREPREPDDLAGTRLEVEVGEDRPANAACAQDRLAARGGRAAHRARDRAAEHQVDQLLLVQLGGLVRADLGTVAQHADAVGDREDLVEPVRDIEDADTALAHAPHGLEQDLDLGLRERRGRLVEHQHARAVLPLPEGAGDGDTGALGSGELRHRAPDVDLEAQRREHVVRAAALGTPQDPPAGAGLEAAPEGEVLHDAERVDERQILVDEAESGVA